VFAAATPPINFTAGILIGLVGYAVAGGGARCGFLFGLAANFVALRFVPDVMARFTSLPAVAGWTALVLLSAAQAVPWAIGNAIAKRLGWVPRWLAFGVGVYVATFVPAVFPWTPAGGLTGWPALVQIADTFGERGASFAIALACGLVALRTRRTLTIATAIVIVLLGYGALRMHIIEGERQRAPHARVALLEPDFDATFRWDPSRAEAMLERLTALTKSAESNGAQLTVWPESAYPYTLAHGVKHTPDGKRSLLQPGVHGPILTGVYLSKGGGIGTNSAILVHPGGSVDPSYDKRHLLWFGETVPLGDVFPILRQIFSRGTGLDPGTESVPMRTGPIVAAVLDCYEDTLPAAGREAMSVRPNLLVNITNDAWFAGTAESELHLRLAVLRAIETRRDLVRAVNRGPTTWVDATGRIRSRREAAAGLGPPPPLVADAALLDSPLTLYTRAGDVPLVLLVALALLTKRYGRHSRSREGARS
jgi:apolipoprotein N-acyltransferase